MFGNTKYVVIYSFLGNSETSAIRTQTPGNYPKRNKLHLEHGESLKTTKYVHYDVANALDQDGFQCIVPNVNVHSTK